MRIRLLFPPHWTPTMPHLALPTLTACLQARGHDVAQRDLNVEAFDYLLSHANLEEAIESARYRYRLLSRRARRDAMEQAELEHLDTILTDVAALAQDIELAKRIMRSPTFYEADENLGAMLTVIDALEIASAPHYPSSFGWYGYQTMHSPASSREIMAATRDRRRDVFAGFWERCAIPELAAAEPDLIGISLTSAHQVIPGFCLAAAIRAWNPEIHITLGGKMINCWRDRLATVPELFALFDSAVMYEGERALTALAETLERGEELSAVPNLIYAEGDRIRVNEIDAPAHVESLPLPTYDGLPLEKYLVPKPVLPIEACRGCYWRRCAFCNLGYGQSRRVQARRPETVLDHLEALGERYGVNHFFFVDEALSPAMLRAISKGIREREMDVHWAACARFEETLTRELLGHIKRAGGEMLMYGLESAAPRVLERIDKGSTPQTISRVLREGAAAGLLNHVFCFFGFPGERDVDAEQTTLFMLDHLDVLHNVAGGTFELEPDSRIHADPTAYGIEPLLPSDDLAFRYDYAETGAHPPDAGQRRLERFAQELGARRAPRYFLYDVYNLLYASHLPDYRLLSDAL